MMLLNELAALEDSDSLHLGRLLLILKAMSARDRLHPIAGLTKLAKLDFLLRYPVFLQRALAAKNVSTKSVELEEYETRSVESSMVRYRFGPWDSRYRRFLNLLSAKGLVRVAVEGRTVVIFLTEEGSRKAEQIAELEPFRKLENRAKLLRHFDMTATNLMKFIYTTFPEIGSLRPGKAIL